MDWSACSHDEREPRIGHGPVVLHPSEDATARHRPEPLGMQDLLLSFLGANFKESQDQGRPWLILRLDSWLVKEVAGTKLGSSGEENCAMCLQEVQPLLK